jgi:hypothetical protein
MLHRSSTGVVAASLDLFLSTVGYLWPTAILMTDADKDFGGLTLFLIAATLTRSSTYSLLTAPTRFGALSTERRSTRSGWPSRRER